jgi:hypothetical protein
MARNLTDSVDGFLRNATYLAHDRDPLFTEAFEAILTERGVKCVRIPARMLTVNYIHPGTTITSPHCCRG